MWESIKAWLISQLNDLLNWFMQFFEWGPKKLFSWLMDGLASFIEIIPVPDFISAAGSFFGGIPAGISYALSFFAVNEGLLMIVSALVLRFILRRIPFIG